MSRVEYRLRSFLESGLVFEDVFASYFKFSTQCYENVIYEISYVVLSLN